MIPVNLTFRQVILTIEKRTTTTSLSLKDREDLYAVTHSFLVTIQHIQTQDNAILVVQLETLKIMLRSW